MKQKYRSAQGVINTLTNEKFYEFTLTGQFEDVLGTHADIQWSPPTRRRGIRRRGKRSVPLQDPGKNQGNPPHVFPEPPEVEIFNNLEEEGPPVQERPSGF